MSHNLREILKNIGITQQELADYLGITRQYLNSYLDETYEDPKLPPKYLDNIMFLFECKSREELYAPNFQRNAKMIRKRMNLIKSTKERFDNLFNIENEEKFELFKMIEYFQSLINLDKKLLESYSILMENLTANPTYKALLTYIGKRYMIIDFNDQQYNDSDLKSREALIYKALEGKDLDFADYESLYQSFYHTTKQQHNIDIEALKLSLNELGYTNITHKEVMDILNKYNQMIQFEKE